MTGPRCPRPCAAQARENAMYTRREALFDMQADPLETANLAGDPAHRKTVLDHRKILADFAARHNDETAKAMLADDVTPRPFEAGPGRGARSPA